MTLNSPTIQDPVPERKEKNYAVVRRSRFQMA